MPAQPGDAPPIPAPVRARILGSLRSLYGPDAEQTWQRLERLLAAFQERRPVGVEPAGGGELTERDAILITYADQFREPGVPPLQTLRRVLVETLGRPVSGVHLLPFFPFSSDDGFSVVDYTRVGPGLGSWDDVTRLGQDLRLMFDAVVNHVSRGSDWFRAFVRGEPEWASWFITLDPGAPTGWVSEVVRPRALPLLTLVDTAAGEKLVWTTFSDDQIDLNYAHPPVLLKMLEVLLFYVEKGASLIRLDAIAYLWKRAGTPCIHLPETHEVVKLMRAVLDAVAPTTVLITETNVPHEDNVSYLGALLPGAGRTDEAQMVYQFPLPPLLMHTLLTGSAATLSRWAASLETPPGTAFFNFTASHDGIGLMPVRGLLSDTEIEALVATALAHGGLASYKTNPDGSRGVYELNISYFDALSDPAGNKPLGLQVARFMASQAIMLALAGVPGIYVHSLLGSRSWAAGVARAGHNRAINRQKLDRAALEADLADPASLRRQVFDAYRRLLRARAAEPAFHPSGPQQVLFLGDALFALLRTAPDGKSRVLCLHNVSEREQPVDLRDLPDDLRGSWLDLLGEEKQESGSEPGLNLPPFAVRWLKHLPAP